MTQPSIESLLAGGGAGLKFPTIGTTHIGTILASSVSQQTKFGTQDPDFYDDGRPKWQIVLSLQTSYRDPEVQADDGQRSLYVKGNMLTGLSRALKPHGLKAPEVGGVIIVKFTEEEPTKKGNPIKKFSVGYKPAQASAVEDVVAQAGTSPAGAPTQVQQEPVAQPQVQAQPVAQQQPVAQAAAPVSNEEAELLALLNGQTS